MISEELDNVGGEYNAFTGKEQTGYWVKVAKQHFPLALDVVSDLYLNSILDEKEIEKERGVILQEAAMYRDMPHRYVWDVYEELLYGDQPAGWDIVGTEDNIKRFKRQDFLEYFKRMYVPKSTVVVIAGNFEENEALQLIKERFSSSAAKEGDDKKDTNDKQNQPRLKVFYKDTDQTHLILGVRSCDMFHKDRYITVILGTILGSGMSSRMFSNIREKHGLTYYIDAASEQMTDTGYLFTRAGVEAKNVEKTVKLILKELAIMKEKIVSSKELKKAKEYIKGKTLMSLESSSSVAHFFGDEELFKNELLTPEQIFKEIDAVSAEDIKRVAGEIFVDDKLNLAIIGPLRNEERLFQILTFKK